MKKVMLVFMTFVLALSLISCDELLAGIGSDYGNGGTNRDAESVKDTTPIHPMPPETIENSGDALTYICVDWIDFVRINGIVYDGGFENKTVDESKIGEKIGEIKYQVRSSMVTSEEMEEASKADFASYIRPVGCEIFAVKNDEDSIAVLDGGIYYLYTHKVNRAIAFEVFGGETYSPPGENCVNHGVTVNTFDQLCEAFGGEDALPAELSEKYGGDNLQDITLVIVSLFSGWGGTEYGITSVSKFCDDLFVNVVQLDSSGCGDDAVHYWTFYIEIPKTDDKNVVINLSDAKPLEKDPQLAQIPYEKMSKYLKYQTETDHSCYEGKAVLSKEVAEEIARSLNDRSYYYSYVRYCPYNNYWLVELAPWMNSNGYTLDVVIRAADGKVIATHETYIEFIE